VNEEMIFRRSLKLPVAIGDWTQLKATVEKEKTVSTGVFCFDRLGEPELQKVHRDHYLLGERILQKASKDLKLKFSLRSVFAEQLNYATLQQRLSGTLIQARCLFSEGIQWEFYTDWATMEILLNRSLGGDPVADQRSQVTALDREAIKTIMGDTLQDCATLWGLKGAPQEIVINGPAIQKDPALTAKDGIVLITLEIQIGDTQIGQFWIAYSNKMLHRLLKSMPAAPSVVRIRLEEENLTSLMIPVRIELGNTELILTELKNLEPGDVIQLDRKLGESVEISLGKTTVLQGQLGQQNGHVAAQVLTRFMPSESLADRYRQVAEPSPVVEPIEEPPPPVEEHWEEPPAETIEENEESDDLFESLEEEEEVEKAPEATVPTEPSESAEDDDIFKDLNLEDDSFPWEEEKT
jgi:flagellar motor switch/type III secretory pathway protein FliN